MNRGANMNFSQVTDQFETTAPGTDAFLTVKEEMRSLVASDSARAAAYFLMNKIIVDYDSSREPF
jgi:hypothetical protein